MTYTFCKKCAASIKALNLTEAVLALAKKGAWLCPNDKALCGTKKGTKIQ